MTLEKVWKYNANIHVQMQIEEFNDFIEVRSKRKKNVKESQTELRLKLNENNNNKDEGISSASPTESDQGALGLSVFRRYLDF